MSENLFILFFDKSNDVSTKQLKQNIKFDFHVSANARVKYNFDKSFYSITGHLITPDFTSARILSEKINSIREANNIFNNYVTPGLINALALLHETFHFVFRHYEEIENPGVFARGVEFLKKELGSKDLDNLFEQYLSEFPPLTVFNNTETIDQYLNGITEGKSNKEIIFEEIVLLHFENINPGFVALKDIFDDKPLSEDPVYNRFIDAADNFFLTEKPLSIENKSIFRTLKDVITINPHDPLLQLNYVQEKWKLFLYDKFGNRLLLGGDLLKEDEKLFIQHGGIGTPPVPVYDLFTFDEVLEIKEAAVKGEFSKEELSTLDNATYSLYFEEEKFTQDVDWMPNVVMIAKNAFVWLDQLSKKYKRSINRLDEIPDEELDILAKWNFTALWLIGLWERSKASQKIKQFCGNPDAASSAYSLYSYDVANDLGGEEAFQNLKHRCALRGIRLASDMVPNHTGIFSKWIIENPHFYIQSSLPPYPSYTFTGPDLSDDPRITIRIEDKYYSMKDAAVVFQRIDNLTGEVRYIYHGNDGTNMPWNDTAQLNILIPEVREALIQAIMHVARKTPIIRFDAAMTLAKQHFARLWFPQPGKGGAVPSRSEYAMTKEMFDRILPNEFWRDVVDRINSEMPSTLLLAEAFWLMESYFVRTLGMHRVYNSAFMHMFMKEENRKFRKTLINTLEFNPEILKRYVNFMSNPDEETAVNQFGKGDKYFGCAVMMVTLPGLPMFAHGQVEGFTEKYGMEYKRAYYNEVADSYLIKRHEDELFPLMKKRYLFAEVENFHLFDFIDDEDGLNENVFAFTNQAGNERALIIYNNSYFQTSGRIKLSSGKVLHGEGSPVVTTKISDALNCKKDDDIYYTFKDYRTKLEYILPASMIYSEGINFTLTGYQYNAFLDFNEIKDVNGEYKQLYFYLNGRGVPSINDALYEMKLNPLHSTFVSLCSRDVINELKEILESYDDRKAVKLSSLTEARINSILNEIESYYGLLLNEEKIISSISDDLIRVNKLKQYALKNSSEKKKTKGTFSNEFILAEHHIKPAYVDFMVLYIIVKRLLLAVYDAEKRDIPGNLFISLMLDKAVWQGLLRLAEDYNTIKLEFDLIKILSTTKSLFPKYKYVYGKKSEQDAARIINYTNNLLFLLDKSYVKYFLNVNEYMGISYFSKEQFELLLKWEFTFELIRRIEWLEEIEAKRNGRELSFDDLMKKQNVKNAIAEMKNYYDDLILTAEKTGYRLNHFISELKSYIPHQKNRAVKKNNSTTKKVSKKKTSSKKKKA